MKKLAFIFVFLSACSSVSQDYGSTLQPWIGQSQQRLQQSWGMPYNITYVTPETKVWTFMKIAPSGGNDHPYPNEVYYPAVAMPDFGFPSQPQYMAKSCKTLFTITNDIVTDYSFNGDNCIVKELD